MRRQIGPARRLVAGAIGAAGLVWLLAPAFAARPSGPLPFPVPAADRAQVEQVVEQAHVATRVQGEAIATDPRVFEYLLDHPEFATHVTRALRLARYRIWQTPEGLFMDDGWGTRGRFWVLHTGPGVRVFRARGEHRKGPLPPIRGEAVTLIEYRVTPTGGDGALVQPAVAGYLRLDSRLLGVLLDLGGAAVQAKADREAGRLMKVFAKVSRALAQDPARVWARLQQQPDVPHRELEEFGRLLNRR